MSVRWNTSLGLVVAVPAVVLAACTKQAATGPRDAGTPVASAVARPVASAPQAKTTSTIFSGSYVAKAAAIDLGKGEKVVKWPPNPASGALGNGTITVVVDGPGGDVHGEAKGPLGDLLVNGDWDGRNLRANLTPKNPNGDDAMTGVMTLVADGASMRGTLRVSSRDARVVREATVDVSRK